MAFVKYHQPCPLCDSSDAVSINDDDSAYCFSCDKRIIDYSKLMGGQIENNVKEFEVHKSNSTNDVEGSFHPLADRCITLDTAKKYNVKSIYSKDGKFILISNEG